MPRSDALTSATLTEALGAVGQLVCALARHRLSGFLRHFVEIVRDVCTEHFSFLHSG